MSENRARLRRAFALFKAIKLRQTELECHGLLGDAANQPQGLNILAGIAGATQDHVTAVELLFRAVSCAMPMVNLQNVWMLMSMSSPWRRVVNQIKT